MDKVREYIEQRSLDVVREFLKEIGAERALGAVSLDASLERDLGIGSLEKAELLHRLEKEFDVNLPERMIAEARTAGGFVDEIIKGNPITAIKFKKVKSVVQSKQIDVSSAKTLVEMLSLYIELNPDRPHIYLQDEKGDEHCIRYSDLYKNAQFVAGGLKKRGLRPGETVAIMLPTCEEFFYSFMGVLFAGGIPVPIYPPFRPNQIEEYARREALILKNAEVRVLITFHQAETLSKLLRTFIPSLIDVLTTQELMKDKIEASPEPLTADDPAMIQYTSGSTGDPKGVLLNHSNILANIHAVGDALKVGPTELCVSWLPLYHDMGLIGAWLHSLYYGVPAVIMSPLTFLAHPERWLWTIHYHRATVSAGPNFAYELCVKKIDKKTIEGLDLSSWRLAFNGAEAIYPETIERFIEKFEPYGFRREAMYPAYGLAESSVALTLPPLERGPRIDRVQRLPFEEQQLALPASSDDEHALEFVCCGAALKGHKIRVVDDKTQVLSERHIGQLQFQGPSSMQGYYRNPDMTAAVYHDGWWDTGDLAYIADNEVFITGRKKDVIIKAGKNLYPAEIEEIVASVKQVREGCVAAFGVSDPRTGTERLVVVGETREKNDEKRQQIKAEIVSLVSSNLGLPPDEVVLVAPRIIPKTSSGKLRRSTCKQMYMGNKLTKHRRPLWFQVTKLFCEGLCKKIVGYLGLFARLFYTAYVSVVALFTLLPTWLMVFILPQAKARALSKRWAKCYFTLIGCPIHIEGYENITPDQPLIFVVNHASYSDAIVLLASMPSNVLCVGKKEVLDLPIVRTFFKRLGYLTVERMDFTQSISDTKHIEDKLHARNSIALMPEGTFAYATGLRPFKFGAFKLAVESNTPICPVAITGTRYILRSGSHLPRPGRVSVKILPAIVAENKDWSEVVRLRSEARQAIAKHCGEKTLDLIRAGYYTPD